jgi:hypothetical protein
MAMGINILINLTHAATTLIRTSDTGAGLLKACLETALQEKNRSNQELDV